MRCHYALRLACLLFILTTLVVAQAPSPQTPSRADILGSEYGP